MTDFLASHLGDLLARQPLPQKQSSTKEHHSQVNVNPSSSKKPERTRALTSSFSTDFGGSKPRYSPCFEYLASPVSPGSQKSSFSVGRGASSSSSPSPQNKSGTFGFFSDGKEDGRGQKAGRRDPSTSTTTSSSSSPLQLSSSPPTTSGSKSPVNEGRNASEKISQSHQRRVSHNSTPATSAPVKKQTSQGPSPRFTSMSSPAYNPPQHGKVIFNSPKSLQTRPSQSSSSSVVSSQTNRFRLVPCGSDGRSFRFVTEDEAEDQGQIRRNEVRISELMSSSSGSQVGGGIRRAGTVAASSSSSSQGTVEASIKEPSVQQILVSTSILVNSSPIEESNRTQLLQPPARSNSSTGGSKVENLSPFAPTSDIKASFEVLTDASQLDDGHSSSGVSMLEAATEALQSNQPQALEEARTFVFQSGKLVKSRRGSQNSDPSPSNSFSHQAGDRPKGFKRSALLEEFALDTSEGLGSFDATRPTLHVHRGRSSRRNSNNATSQSPRPHAQVKQSPGVVPADSERTPTSMPPRDVKTWVSGVSKLDSIFAPSMRNESVKEMSQDQVAELQETFNTLDVNENGEPGECFKIQRKAGTKKKGSKKEGQKGSSGERSLTLSLASPEIGSNGPSFVTCLTFLMPSDSPFSNFPRSLVRAKSAFFRRRRSYRIRLAHFRRRDQGRSF